MKYYTVHRPAVPSTDTLGQADELIFVKEGFAGAGLLFAPAWLLFHLLWIEAGVFFIVFFLISTIVNLTGLDPTITVISWIFMSFIIGFEGNNMIRWKLERSDYQMIGTISGANQYDCELRFFSFWSPEQQDMEETERLIPGTPTGTAKLSEL